MDDFQKCKHDFLKEAFVPWIKGELGTMDLLPNLEADAEAFATMSMRILDKPDISEPANTAFNTEQPPFDVYYDEV